MTKGLRECAGSGKLYKDPYACETCAGAARTVEYFADLHKSCMDWIFVPKLARMPPKTDLKPKKDPLSSSRTLCSTKSADVKSEDVALPHVPRLTSRGAASASVPLSSATVCSVRGNLRTRNDIEQKNIKRLRRSVNVSADPAQA